MGSGGVSSVEVAADISTPACAAPPLPSPIGGAMGAGLTALFAMEVIPFRKTLRYHR